MKKRRSYSRVRTPRIPGGYQRVITARLSDSQYERLEKVSQERGLPLSSLIREIIVRFLTSNVASIAPPRREVTALRERAQDRAAYGGGRLGRPRSLRG